ncbi:MAG: sulfite exporter TauE/SafE family protein, partial [Acidimicrobiia bacterium]
LVYGAGQEPQAATATSLLLVGTAALVGMTAHRRAGRVQIRTGLMFGLTGIGGAIVGTALNRRLDPNVLLLGFSVLILVAAWRMLTGCPTCTRVGAEREIEHVPSQRSAIAVRRRIDARMVCKVAVAGTGVGFLAGLFGVGGGFVIVPALTLVLGMSMPEAIGTSLLVIAINSATALATRIGSSTVDWRIAVPFTLAAVAGVLAGGRIADRLDAERSLRWFAGLLVAVACYTAVRATTAIVA